MPGMDRPRKVRHVLAAGLLACAFVGLPFADAAPLEAQAVIGGDWREDVRGFARGLIEAGLAPGFGLAVAAGDWVVYEEGFGVADGSTGRGITPATPFYIASTTKSLTALAAALLADRGELDLDAPIERYIPGLVLPEGVEPGSIRVRHLLTLTHGLSGSGPVVIRTAFTGQFDRDELPGLVRHHAPTGEFGTFSYNNLGFNLLGMVLEGATGLPWQAVVEREVLAPLGMHGTTATLPQRAGERIALPHEVDPAGDFVRAPLDKDDRNLHAAGGHFATAGDMARYLAAHLAGGRVDGTDLLPVAPIRATQEPHVAQDRRFGPFTRHAWGYGWDIGRYGEDLLIHRFGSFRGYRSHVSFMPERGVGVVVLTNGDGPASPAADLLATFVYDRLAGGEDLDATYRDRVGELADRAAQGRAALRSELANRAARLEMDHRPPDEFAGRYRSPELGTIEFRVVAGGLEYRMGVVRGRAEVFDGARDALRIEVGGGGIVAAFLFDEGEGPARAVQLAGSEFRRVEP